MKDELYTLRLRNEVTRLQRRVTRQKQVIDHASTGYPPSLILTRAKTAREWLSELPDGWREEALAGTEDKIKSGSPRHLYGVIMDYVGSCGDFSHLPSGQHRWMAVAQAINNGTPIPPHPSTVKPKQPKVERLEVKQDINGLLYAGGLELSSYLSRADFRGFVYQVNGVDLVRNFALGWLDWSAGIPVLLDQPMGLECQAVHPKSVVVQR